MVPFTGSEIISYHRLGKTYRCQPHDSGIISCRRLGKTYRSHPQDSGIISYRRLGKTYRCHPQDSEIISYRPSGTTDRCHPQVLRMAPIGCPEMLRNCHYLLRNNPAEHSSQSRLALTILYHVILAKIGDA
jgi:hypothetical protein